MIPQALLDSVSNEEKIIFISSQISRKRAVNLARVISFVGFTSLILFMGVELDFSFLIINFFSSPFTSILSIVLISIPFGASYFMGRIFSHKNYFLITNERIYILSKVGSIETVERLDFKSLIAFDLTRQFLDNKNYGTITLFFQNECMRKLKNVPDFKQFQKIFESILYNYSNIREKYSNEEQKLGASFPLKLYISGRIFETTRKSLIKNYIALILTPVIAAIIISVLIFLISLEMITPYIIGYGGFMGVLFTMVPISNIVLIRKRRSSQDDVLTVEKDKIFLNTNQDRVIKFNAEISLHFMKVLKPGNIVPEWTENTNAVLINPSYDSNEGILFGPIDDSPEFFQFLLIHLVKWKGDNSLLLNEQELKQIGKSNASILQRASLQEEKLEQEFQGGDFILNKELKASINRYLNPNEEIKIIYHPNVSMMKNYIALFIGAIIIVLDILFFNPFTNDNFLIIIPFMFLLLIPFVLCFQGLCFLSSKILMKKSVYILTNQKIIYKYGNKLCFITYDNIQSISYQKKPFARHVRDLILNLNYSVENNPYINKNVIYIPKIPNKFDFLHEIDVLRGYN